MVSNCGKRFHLEVCSRDFEAELLRLIRGGKNIHPKVSERTRLLLKKWAQSKDFKKDPQLNLIPSLYEKLKSEGISFHSSDPSKRKSSVPDETMLKNPDYVANAEEEAQLAKAIELSIQEAKKRGIKTNDTAPVSTTTSSSSSSLTNHHSTTTTTSSLYPSFNMSDMNNTTASTTNKSSEAKEPIKARAIYDFEAAEDNELTFKAGEIILVTDSSDANWWKGSNHRGEGLFPANFVSTDLNAEPESCKLKQFFFFFQPFFLLWTDTTTKNSESKKVQFNEEVKVVKVDKDEIKPEDVTIDEGKIDELMSMLQEADPKSFDDPDELLRSEGTFRFLSPYVDMLFIYKLSF